MSDDQEYLGDAVYAEWNGHEQQVVLTTKNLFGGTDQVIYLEIATCVALLEYFRKIAPLTRPVIDTAGEETPCADGPGRDTSI